MNRRLFIGCVLSGLAALLIPTKVEPKPHAVLVKLNGREALKKMLVSGHYERFYSQKRGDGEMPDIDMDVFPKSRV